MGRLIALLLAEASLVALVHREAATRLADPAGLLVVPPGDLVVALVHAAAWLAAWWLLLGTAHDLLVQARRGPRGRRVAPRWVQRVVGQALGTAMAVGVVAAPVGATTTAAAPPLQVVTPPVPPVALPPASLPVEARPGVAAPMQAPAEEAPPAAGAAVQMPAAAPVPAPDPGSADGQVPAGAPDRAPGDGTPDPAATHVVAAGENLWTIARQQLIDAGLPHGDRDVHAHWVALIRANVDTLPSGDPDLIHPGDLLQVPAAPRASEGVGREGGV